MKELQFGTVMNTHTEATIRQHNEELYEILKNNMRHNISAGIEAVKLGYGIQFCAIVWSKL